MITVYSESLVAVKGDWSGNQVVTSFPKRFHCRSPLANPKVMMPGFDLCYNSENQLILYAKISLAWGDLSLLGPLGVSKWRWGVPRVPLWKGKAVGILVWVCSSFNLSKCRGVSWQSVLPSICGVPISMLYANDRWGLLECWRWFDVIKEEDLLEDCIYAIDLDDSDWKGHLAPFQSKLFKISAETSWKWLHFSFLGS